MDHGGTVAACRVRHFAIQLDELGVINVSVELASMKLSRRYGSTKGGAFACRDDANRAGLRKAPGSR